MKTKPYRRGLGWGIAGAVMVCWAAATRGQSGFEITRATLEASGRFEMGAVGPPGSRCLLQFTDDLGRPFSDIADSSRTVGADGAMVWSWDEAAISTAFFRIRQTSSRTLLTWEELVNGFEGTFAVPLAEEGEFRFGYSSGVHAQLGNGNLLVAGHPYHDRQAQVALPAILDGREGTRVGGWVDITGGLLPEGWSPGGEQYVLGGMLEVGGRIYFTKHQWYNAAGTDWQTQGFHEGPLDGSGTVSGMWGVANDQAHHSRVGGYMSAPPRVLREAGYVSLAGLEGTSGAALGRWGPNLFAIKAAVSNGAVDAATLICHPTEALQAPNVRASNATGAWWVANRPANETWWIANKVTDMKWIETDNVHGVLCFVYRGLGQTWYGEWNEGPGLPNPYGRNGGYGYHAEGWALQSWVYDPDEVMEVFRGVRDPSSLVPVEAVLLTERLPGSAGETHHSLFTGSARADLKVSVSGNRLIVLAGNEHPASEWEHTPKGFVFRLP